MKHLPLLLGALALVGAGCVTPAAEPTPPVDEPAVEQANGTADEAADADVSFVEETVSFSNAELGLAFDYPATWGEPEIVEEQGEPGEDGAACVATRAVIFPSLGGDAVLISTASTGDCEPMGRGGYWGDAAVAITADGFPVSMCEANSQTPTTCTSWESETGLRVWQRSMSNYVPAFADEALARVNEYALYNEGHELAGVLISEERLLLSGLDHQTPALRALVESISFVKE